MSPRRPVRLHVDRLVLEGFHPRDRARVAAAFQAELERLLAEGPLPEALAGGSTTLDALQAPAIHAAPGARPERVGAEAARSLHAGLSAGGAPG